MFRDDFGAAKNLSHELEISCSNRAMEMWIYENRRKWLEHWIAQAGGRPEFMKTYGYTRAQIAQYLSEGYNDGRSIGDVAARRIEKKLNKKDRPMDKPFEEAKVDANKQQVVKKDDLLNASEIGELVTLFVQASPGWREYILGAARDSAKAIAKGDRRDGTDQPQG